MKMADAKTLAQSVKEIVAAVPCGMVATYGDVAALAGYPAHARLVGRILGEIGMNSELPCHRIVNSAGRPAPHWHSQRALLAAEGVAFGRNGNVDMKRHRWLPDSPC